MLFRDITNITTDMEKTYTTVRLTSESADKLKLIRTSFDLLSGDNKTYDDMVDRFAELVLANEPKVAPILKAALEEHGYITK